MDYDESGGECIIRKISKLFIVISATLMWLTKMMEITFYVLTHSLGSGPGLFEQ